MAFVKLVVVLSILSTISSPLASQVSQNEELDNSETALISEQENGIGDLALGGIDTLLKMLLDAISPGLMKNQIREFAATIGDALDSGRNLLNLFMNDYFGYKNFAYYTERLLEEAATPQDVVDAILAMMAIGSNALLTPQ